MFDNVNWLSKRDSKNYILSVSLSSTSISDGQFTLPSQMIEPNYATEETIALLEEFDASKKLFEAGAATFRVLIYFVFSILLISYRNLTFFKRFFVARDF